METSIKTRVSQELKSDAASVLQSCGLNVSTAIRLFLEQVVISRGLPFEVTCMPSEKTAIALKEAARLEDQAAHRYSSVDEMLKGLSSEGKQEK